MAPEQAQAQMQAVASPPAQEQAPGIAIVRYQGAEYVMVTELTEREKYDAERITERSLFDLQGYTLALLLAYFTLKRHAGYEGDFDNFLDASGFQLDEQAPPLAPSVAPSPVGANGIVPTEVAGSQVSPPSSESSPG